MDEYISKTELLKVINTDVAEADNERCVQLLNAILYAPTADVVPKSKVDSEIKVWQELYADTVSKWEKAYEELEIKLENARAEVAREIFEELKQKRNELWNTGKYTMFECWCKAEDEVKKKYTEEKE